MAVEIKESGGNIVEIHVTGKLAHADYEQFVPVTERLIEQHGKVRILFGMHDFHGWEMAALWDDSKFAFKHFHDIERIAMVGESKWEKGMAVFCKPFTSAKIRYFEHDKIDDAAAWLQEE